MKVALCAIAKDEDNYIDEWVRYHLKLGIDDIFIYQNEWRYGMDVPDNVHLIPFDGECRQLDAYNSFIVEHHSDYDFAMFCDVDEFLTLKDGETLDSFLERHRNAPSIAVNWRLYGDSGLHGVHDGNYSLLGRFVRCEKVLNHHVKQIVNFGVSSGRTFFNNPHCTVTDGAFTPAVGCDGSVVRGPYNENVDIDGHCAFISHFLSKTREEWICNKMPKGKPDFRRNDPSQFENRREVDFDKFNKNDVIDSTARDFMYDMKAERAAIVCIAKDEDYYIDEWIDYHTKIGFDSVFVYQNNWRYGGDRTRYKNVTWIDFDGQSKQVPAYDDFISRYAKDYEWGAFFDVDEFLTMRRDCAVNIKDELRMIGKHASIGVPWLIFGSNGMCCPSDEESHSMIDRFTKCQSGLSNYKKTIVNFSKAGTSIRFSDPHFLRGVQSVDPSGRFHTFGSVFPNDITATKSEQPLILNHYSVLTFEERMARKSKGDAYFGDEYAKTVHRENMERWNALDVISNAETDMTAYNFKKLTT